MTKRRVPWFNKPNQFVEVDTDATVGAVLGVNLFWPDGRLVLPSDFAGTPEEVEEVVNQIYLTTWGSILSKPRNITEAAALTGTGLVTRQADGNWIVRFVEGVEGQTVVTNGNGDAGNPTVGLATVEDSGTGVLLAITRDAYGRITGTRPTEPGDFPSQNINTAATDFIVPAWDAVTSTLTAALRTRTSYTTISTVLFEDYFDRTGYGAFDFLIESGASLTINGIAGGIDGEWLVINNRPSSEGPVTLTNEGGIFTTNEVKTPTGSSYTIAPGNAAILRYVADATYADPGYWVFYAVTSGGAALSHRIDDIVTEAGDVRFLLDKMPYQDRVAIYDDGGARLKLSMVTGTGKSRYLLSPATAGLTYTVDYWTADAEPGPTVMDDAAPIAWTPVYPDAEIDVPYDYTPPPATGGTPPYTYAHVSGTLPPGLTFDPSDARLYGTPTNMGGSPYTFRVEAMDAMSDIAGADQSVAVNEASDPFFANVVSLLHFDSVVTADQIPARTWTVSDTATVSTTTKKFGAGGAYPITGMKADDSADWAFGTGDYTIELWVNFIDDPAGTNQALISNYDASGGGGGYAGFGLLYFMNSLYYYTGTGAGQIAAFPWAPAANTWYHVAITRASGSIRFFVNGVQTGSTIADSTNVVVTRGPYLGKFSVAFGFTFFGALDDSRVTKGIARYTANFTPPAGPFPNS